MKFLLTGIGGFIGFHVARTLLAQGHEIIGLDNLNSYYDVQLKYARLRELGIENSNISWYKYLVSNRYSKFRFIRTNLEDSAVIQMLFANENFDMVVHLGAQAGVRYSLENPYAYIDSNVNGFLHILEGCRHSNIQHLVYASSSSVYGLNSKVPFSEKDGIAHPVSLYAATKKTNELMAHAYSHLYNIPTTGLRFFTVYGPWGRPDMAPFIFMDAILKKHPIKIFNKGNMFRDFTFIDDIVEGIIRIIPRIPQPDPEWESSDPVPDKSSAPYRIYNLGNSSPVRLMDFIQTIEDAVKSEAQKNYLPMQPGDVYRTYADTSSLEKDLNFKPSTSIQEGVEKTVEWFRSYYQL